MFSNQLFFGTGDSADVLYSGSAGWTTSSLLDPPPKRPIPGTNSQKKTRQQGWLARGWVRLGAGIAAAVALHAVLWNLLSLSHAAVGYWYLVYLPALAFLVLLFNWVCGAALLGCLSFSRLFNWPWGHLGHSFALLPLLTLGALLVSFLQWNQVKHRHHSMLEAKWRQLLGGMDEAVYFFNASELLVCASPAAVRLSHQPYALMRGMTIDQLLAGDGHPWVTVGAAAAGAAAGHEHNSIRKALHTNLPVKVEYLIPGAAPQLPSRNLTGAALPWKISGHKAAGVVLVLRDQTVERQLETRMAEAERHLAIGQMAAGITHDFNNILEVIEKATAILALNLGESNQEQQNYLRAIHLGVVRGGETLRRLREYLSGGVSGQDALDISDLARDAVELTRPLWRHQETHIRLVSDLQPVLPVRGNAVDLRRLLTNLLLNALEAVKENGGQVSIHTQNDGLCVRCRVADNGPGIPLEHQAYIFRPYFTTKSAGSGLGLAESQKIALSHHGRLSFTSQPGQGTEFVLELPAIPATMAQSA